MSNLQLLKTYYKWFGNGYLGPDIFERYPETRIIPAYIVQHFAGARHVLDLGFGTGLWFWASFLPSLERLDGIDAHRQALQEADKVFRLGEVPEGFRAAHARIGRDFGPGDLQKLETKRGRFVFQDYRRPWPEALLSARYDLVTEHGGGLGIVSSDDEFTGVVRQVARVLKPSGCVLFVNFAMAPSALERRIRKIAPPGFRLREELFVQGTREAGLRMVDFHAIDAPAGMPGVREFFFGYVQRQANSALE